MYEAIDNVLIKTTGKCNFNCSYCFNTLAGKKQPAFDKFDDLYNFLVNQNLVNDFKVSLLGGEITTNISPIIRLKSVMDQVASTKGIRYKFACTTNGSNREVLEYLFNIGIFETKYVHISWDGLGENLRYRPKEFDDKYYEDLFKWHGQINSDTHVSVGLTKENVNKLFDNFKFLLDCGMKTVGYYVIHGYKYDKSIYDVFKKQLEKFMEYYSIHKQNKEWHFDNYRWYLESKQVKYNFICPKLGNLICIDYEGDIYPCPWLLEHKLFKLGNLKTGYDKNALQNFVKCYNEPYNCDYKNCKNIQCIVCPAANKVINGKLCKTFHDVCELYNIEREIFNKYDVYEELYIKESKPQNNIPEFMKNE